MATARKTVALKNAEKRIEELEKKLKDVESTKDMYSSNYNTMKKEVDGLHAVLDTLAIPRTEEGSYQDYPLSVRLFAWAMKREK